MSPVAEPRLRIAAICGGDTESVARIVGALPKTDGLSCVVSCAAAPDLGDTLRAVSRLSVVDVRSSVPLEANRLYVVPADREVAVHQSEIVVAPPNGHGCVDRLLRSISDAAASSSIVVLLASTGTDGALGLKRVKETGGIVICQAVVTGAVSELPQAAIDTGFVDLVLPLEDIAPRIAQLASDDATKLALPLDDTTRPPEQIADVFREILAMVRIRTGHDFSWYRRATLYRRIARRMQVCQTSTIHDYQRYLREDPSELGDLVRDFLISVTNFFRDPEAFHALADQVLPRLFENRSGGDQVRVWVAGCATGEEAYSIGMLLAEAASRLADPPELQVFATDIDEGALAEARAGVYPALIETDVSRERLERFFTRENAHYRVNQELREIMLFSPHNLLRDPPFTRLDLVSCRNLLIYFNRDAQDRMLGTFHFALKPDGFLFLGSSESGEGTQQFGSLDAKMRLFERRMGARTVTADALIATRRWSSPRPVLPAPPKERASASFGELHHRVVELYAPPSILVNDDLDIVHLSEHAGRFLTVAGGVPTRQVLRLAHQALRFELRGAIYAARQPDRGSDTRVVRFDDNGKTRVVEIRVRSVDMPETGRGTLLILFDELDDTTAARPPADPHLDPTMCEMEDELHRTREQLRTTVEQYETSLEELNASNEELHAINEELRSASEELETSKEELQSVNEELTTLNHELNDKVDEVSRANSDLQNLMKSTDIGVLFLDRSLMIKRYTSRAQELFNVIPTDLGRPFVHLTHKFDQDDLVSIAQQVLADLRSTERTLTTRDQRKYLSRFLPYRSLDDRIEGVVLTFVEITELEHAKQAQRRSEAEQRTAEERLAFALRSAPVAVIARDANLDTTWAFVHGRELPAASRRSLDIFPAAHAQRFDAATRNVLATGVGERIELELGLGEQLRTYDFRIEPGRVGSSVAVTAVGFDISPSKQAELTLRDSDRRKDEFLATLSHELRNPLTPLRVAFEILRRPDADPPKVAKAVAIMDQQLDLLIRLVDDLLDVSRITQGKVQLELRDVEMVRVIQTALEATRPLIDEAGHTLDAKLGVARAHVLGDYGRLTQVMTNLLTNAAKYTPNGGTIGVELDVVRKTVIVRVSDNGVGIGADLMPRVFEIFVQSRDELGRSRGGLGIGLNLVRQLVELHGGRVYVESGGTRQGSCFTIELPAAGEGGVGG